MAVSFSAPQTEKPRQLADAIKSNCEVNGGNITETTQHSAYYGNLPEGHTKETVDALADYNSKFVTASHLAVGELAADAFLADPALQTVTANIGYFGPKDSLDFEVSRQKVYQNHLATNEEDKEITKPLVIKFAATCQSAKGQGVKSLREAMGSEFANMFSQ